jgi:D-sedoheptulose 7-phosphate isomerase
MNLKILTNIVNNISEEQIVNLKTLVLNSSEIFLIGNGGSNAIASHMAVDYTKFLNKRCYVPNTSDLITMMVNDYGVENMYSKFIEYYHNNENQLVILISSSGNSKNILQAADKCKELNIPMIILTGFKNSNSLNSFNSDNVKLKYWVDSDSYGVVEMAHHIFLHSIIEA